MPDPTDFAHELVARAKERYSPRETWILFSGGNDSLVLLDHLHDVADVVVHVNTGIGIPETTDFARRVGASYGLPFIELTPPVPYEKLVLTLWKGLPGPGAHRFTYERLKDRPLRALVKERKQAPEDRILFLTGVRSAESVRRMGHVIETRREGAVVWVSPLMHWTNEEMRQYRAERNLPVNEVAANLHMSGECLCGAMADQGPERAERATLRFFYPDFDRRLTAIENECKRRGLPYDEWGVKRQSQEIDTDMLDMSNSPLCQSCAWRNDQPIDGPGHTH